MSSDYSWLYSAVGADGNAADLAALARELESKGELAIAATAYDRAYGLQPNNAELTLARQRLLDRLAVVEHGITFRYIPAGSFLMGSTAGDADEQPVHQVQLNEYWLAETAISWSSFCALMNWEPPPDGHPSGDFKPAPGEALHPVFYLSQENKIRLQYCEDETLRARDWHAHVPGDSPIKQHLGEAERADPMTPWTYERKPMVCVSWQEADELCRLISNSSSVYRLPTEAEWEKAARGGLIDCLYPWGNDPPTHELCDFDRFDELSILPMRRFPPNGYRLYAMSGSVWEWTSDWYDAAYYAESPAQNPVGPTTEGQKVLRGGSWTDCEETMTVSFRMARESKGWEQGWSGHYAPNIGFRLCRVKSTASE